MKKLLALIALAFVPLAHAADWELVATNVSNTSYSVERSTLVKQGDTRRVWILVTYGAAKKDGTRSYKAMAEFDCRGGRRHDLQTLYYDGVDGTGNSTGRSGAEDWDFVPPDSVADTVLKFVCGLR